MNSSFFPRLFPFIRWHTWKSLSHVQLFATPWPIVHGILQAKILEWVAFPSPGDLPNPEIEPRSLLSPALAGGFFTTSATWEALICFMRYQKESNSQSQKVDSGYQNFPGSSAAKESTCSTGDPTSIPGLGRFPGEGNSYPLQHSGLENSMDCIIDGVAESRTQLTE